MSAERPLLLPEDDQLKLALELHGNLLFGIHEDPAKTMKLKSERLSPHYLDIRPGISSFHTRQTIAGAMVMLARLRALSKGSEGINRTYDHLAGTPEAMTSYAATIADMVPGSLLQPRVATAKTTGNKTPILGRYQDGETVAAFDDVVTEGQSKIDTIESFKAAGLEVADYFVLLDRQEGGAPHVTEVTGIEVTPALAVSSMVKMLRAENQISAGQFDNVARYLDQYGEPGAKEAMESPL
jgi:orotate phosphoribosyltransferase